MHNDNSTIHSSSRAVLEEALLCNEGQIEAAMLSILHTQQGGFYLHLLVFPFIYQFNFIGVLVHSSFAND